MKTHLAALLALMACSSATAQQVFEYTNANLGYPVPVPVASLTPVSGYRDYDSLVARQAALALAYEHLTVQKTGSSLMGEDIHSYRFSSAGSSTPEGIAKGSAAFQGCIHAREWAAHEASMAVFEWLAEDRDEDPVADYIVENMEILFHAMNNPDGVKQTNRYYNKVVKYGTSTRPSGGNDYDGRNRRKNMRDADTDITTIGDAALGVDLNRNHSHGWSSGSATSTTYGGTAPGSEPESQALYAAESMINTGRLRLFVDVHSYIPAFYVSRYGNSGLDGAALDCFELMRDTIRAVNNVTFSRLDVDVDGTAPGDSPIGASDEYFASKYHCMSYTAEVRGPRVTYYNGFVLPDNEADANRREVLAGLRAGLYYAAGPAALVQVAVHRNVDGAPSPEPVFLQNRSFDPDSGVRLSETPVAGSLEPGVEYFVVLRYNKPMRELDAQGNASFFGGITGTAPVVAVDGIAALTMQGWSRDGDAAPFAPRRYAGDTVVYSFAVPSGADGARTLRVTMNDMGNRPADGNVQTVADWSGTSGWINSEEWDDTLTQLAIHAPAEASDMWVVR
jgi:hypothetical protein